MPNKNHLLRLILLLVASPMLAQPWQPAPEQMLTRWGAEVTPENAWREYPRPQLQRATWQNLNGLWEYAILDRGAEPGDDYQGTILVPYPVESALSGVGQAVSERQELWYRRTFNLPAAWDGKRVLLHFGAVDWQATVYLNDKKVGEHLGGSDPFSFDITDYLKPSGPQAITVQVWDPTDTGLQPRGKQTLNPEGIWYTAVTGIWQTVWLEPVAKGAVEQLLPIADIDREAVTLQTVLFAPSGDEEMQVSVSFQGELIYEQTQAFDPSLAIAIPHPQLWSPAFPELYDLKVSILNNGVVVDEVSSYFAMRKISLQTDEHGIVHLALNHRPLFQWGTLDQGWWPDGLLTPPSDAGMKYDLEVLKQLGFNMVRKHIKVEPARYYYHADTLGMLVWQDMPSGFEGFTGGNSHVDWDDEEDWQRPAASARQFEAEWTSIMDAVRFFPSIVVWVPFNEGWGQYDTERILSWTMDYDTTRLVNGPSGWTDRGVGDMYDTHQYPGPGIEPPRQHPGRAMILGEFGGLGLPISGHLWDEDRNNWGYRTYRNSHDYLNAYAQAIAGVKAERARGLAAAIYTQTTDVEIETNGLMTYDRAVIKLPLQLAQVLHSSLYDTYSPAEWLIEDSEVNPQPKQFKSAGGEPETMQGPYMAEAEERVLSEQTFQLNKVPDNLGMKLFARGTVRVWLNGYLVVDQVIRTDRHYDDLNLSSYSHWLREGENRLQVEMVAEKKTDFDFGMYCF